MVPYNEYRRRGRYNSDCYQRAIGEKVQFFLLNHLLIAPKVVILRVEIRIYILHITTSLFHLLGT